MRVATADALAAMRHPRASSELARALRDEDRVGSRGGDHRFRQARHACGRPHDCGDAAEPIPMKASGAAPSSPACVTAGERVRCRDHDHRAEPRLRAASPDVRGLRIPERTLALLRDLIAAQAGMHYDDDRLDILRDRLVPLAIERGFDSLLDYYYLLKYDAAAALSGRASWTRCRCRKRTSGARPITSRRWPRAIMPRLIESAAADHPDLVDSVRLG